MEQATLTNSISFYGAGIHSGKEAMLELLPAPEDTGIVFVRTDLNDAQIPAKFSSCPGKRLCLKLRKMFFL
ncbi:UDP-3-O-acyl-N-acetylglucosamine deacetylase, partial [Candidatus Margulisiibacteriota bacterium]